MLLASFVVDMERSCDDPATARSTLGHQQRCNQVNCTYLSAGSCSFDDFDDWSQENYHMRIHIHTAVMGYHRRLPVDWNAARSPRKDTQGTYHRRRCLAEQQVEEHGMVSLWAPSDSRLVRFGALETLWKVLQGRYSAVPEKYHGMVMVSDTGCKMVWNSGSYELAVVEVLRLQGVRAEEIDVSIRTVFR